MESETASPLPARLRPTPERRLGPTAASTAQPQAPAQIVGTQVEVQESTEESAPTAEEPKSRVLRYFEASMWMWLH
jgi:hypothetical protein